MHTRPLPSFLLAAVLLGAIFALPRPATAGAAQQAPCDTSRITIKTGVDPDINLVNLNHVSHSSIFRLRSLPPARFLPSTHRIRPVETTVWQILASVVRFRIEPDGDDILVLADRYGRTIIAEAPSLLCVSARSPFRDLISNSHGTFVGQLGPVGSWRATKIPVQVIGMGLYEPRSGQPAAAPNGIEIHPILHLNFHVKLPR